MAIWDPTDKYNIRQYFQLYGYPEQFITKITYIYIYTLQCIKKIKWEIKLKIDQIENQTKNEICN